MVKQTEILNDGALALRNCGQTRAQISRALGVSKTIVGKWWAGTQVPGHEHRVRLEALGWVRASQWDQFGMGCTRPASLPPRQARAETLVGHPDESTTRGALRAQAVRLRALLDDETLSATARIQVERALGSTLGAIAKLEGVGITEATIVRHPAHRRVMATILASLEPFPDAMKAVADVLQALESA